MRRMYRERCEALLLSYHEHILNECDSILGEMMSHGGRDMLASKNPTKYALAIVELAYQRQRSRANMNLMQRLSNVRGKNTVSHARSCIHSFYQKTPNLTFLPIQRKKVPFFDSIRSVLRGGMEEV